FLVTGSLQRSSMHRDSAPQSISNNPSERSEHPSINRPPAPHSMISGAFPHGEEMKGVRDAIASNSTIGEHSINDGKMKRSAACIAATTSERGKSSNMTRLRPRESQRARRDRRRQLRKHPWSPIVFPITTRIDWPSLARRNDSIAAECPL